MEMDQRPRKVGETVAEYEQLVRAMGQLGDTVRGHNLNLTNQLPGVFHANGFRGSGESVSVDVVRANWTKILEAAQQIEEAAGRIAAQLGQCKPTTSWSDPHGRGER
jgi:hypothetical protein